MEFDSSTTGKANETSTSISQNTTACVNYTGYYGAPFENAGNNTACVVSAGVLPSDVSAFVHNLGFFFIKFFWQSLCFFIYENKLSTLLIFAVS